MTEEVRFYCRWCDNMKPIDDLVEIVSKTEIVTWSGCKDCYKKKPK